MKKNMTTFPPNFVCLALTSRNGKQKVLHPNPDVLKGLQEAEICWENIGQRIVEEGDFEGILTSIPVSGEIGSVDFKCPTEPSQVSGFVNVMLADFRFYLRASTNAAVWLGIHDSGEVLGVEKSSGSWDINDFENTSSIIFLLSPRTQLDCEGSLLRTVKTSCALNLNSQSRCILLPFHQKTAVP